MIIITQADDRTRTVTVLITVRVPLGPAVTARAVTAGPTPAVTVTGGGRGPRHRRLIMMMTSDVTVTVLTRDHLGRALRRSRARPPGVTVTHCRVRGNMIISAASRATDGPVQVQVTSD